MNEKQLAGNFRFLKPTVKIWEDVHGDKRCRLQMEVDPNCYEQVSRLAMTREGVFEADVFILQNETLGTGNKR